MGNCASDGFKKRGGDKRQGAEGRGKPTKDNNKKMVVVGKNEAKQSVNTPHYTAKDEQRAKCVETAEHQQVMASSTPYFDARDDGEQKAVMTPIDASDGEPGAWRKQLEAKIEQCSQEISSIQQQFAHAQGADREILKKRMI